MRRASVVIWNGRRTRCIPSFDLVCVLNLSGTSIAVVA